MQNRPFLFNKVLHHLDTIYHDQALDIDYVTLTQTLLNIMKLPSDQVISHSHVEWQANDIVMITYGNSILSQNNSPLGALHDFTDKYLSDIVNTLHILPFFPFSSDDGFAVKDFDTVDHQLGDWHDINQLTKDYKVMADLVINHCSSEHHWFKNFTEDKSPGKDYFVITSLDDDISQVVRPRTSPLMRPTNTSVGLKQVWCTFSHDQVDLNFKNPAVLIEFAKVIKNYIDQGISLFRLDAVGFLWKEVGTSCLSLHQTHEIIRLIRTLVENINPHIILITETNIPNRENLSYFGNGNEAHCIYNFSLPPLLLNTLITGDCAYLKQWMMSMPPAQLGTAYLNFIASHDGIGLRPIEGLLADNEIQQLINTMQQFGGKISWRTGLNGINSPYEINITLFDALKGTIKGEDQLGLERFICAHAIMVALEGIPAIYIHSLIGTMNDIDKLEKTGHARSINRHQWDYDALTAALANQHSTHHQVYKKMHNLLQIRAKQPAFHPNATQFTLHLGQALFGFWRQSLDKKQSVFCIYNISDQRQSVLLSDINLIITDDWFDLITGQHFKQLDDLIGLNPYQALWISNHY